jgi:hypothetical protein
MTLFSLLVDPQTRSGDPEAIGSLIRKSSYKWGMVATWQRLEQGQFIVL